MMRKDDSEKRRNFLQDCAASHIRINYILQLTSYLIENARFSVAKTTRLIMFKEIIALLCMNNTKHINTLNVKFVRFLNAKAGGTCNYYWALKGLVGLNT